MRYVVMAVLSGLVAGPHVAYGDDVAPMDAGKNVTIRYDAAQAPFEGWGTSLCWWANDVGDWPDERLATLIELICDPEVGLGYTIFRYNIGGGENPEHHHMERHKSMPGFRAGPDDACDWSADANQRRVLQKLIKRVDKPILEAFSNSPPYWMTMSGCAAGHAEGKSNLRPEMYDAFAAYLADVALQYRDRHGITFRTIEPLNEPNADWWRAGKGQEGCHFDSMEQARLIRALRRALDDRKLQAIQISASDASNIDVCLGNVLSYNAETIAALGQINTHSYWGVNRRDLRKFATRRGKRLWQSESGPMDFQGDEMGAALFMATRIARDLNEMRPAAWIDWQVVDHGNWGCIHIDKATGALTRSPSFHAYSTFTRAIRPGDQLMEVDTADLVAAYSPARHEVVVVAVNPSNEPRVYRCRFRGLTASAAEATRSEAFGEGGLTRVAIADGTLVVEVRPQSVVSMRVAGAKLERGTT
ncbi:MAG TPA: glycoside hydrolase [Phycisphaerae bacterium]|nr:glycoside hydrolase [Phycisphaerae bacterium]HRW52121.1 glycoside hydrolase [Phycisphaerae bacterium]